MSDIERPRTSNFTHFDNIGDAGKELAEKRREQRGWRRTVALNAVQFARQHAERDSEPYTQNDADVIMAIMELLDKVAGV